jgi:chromosome segregation ATPase
MLDTIFRNGGDKKQAQDDLRTLVFQARSERNALKSMLEQASAASEKFARTNKALDELHTKAAGAGKEIDRLAALAATFDKRAQGFDNLEAKVGELLRQVGEVQRSSLGEAAAAADLSEHRQLIAELAAQARDAETTLAALRGEGEQLDKLRGLLKRSAGDVERSLGQVGALRGEYDRLSAAESELREEIQGLRTLAHEAHADSSAAAGAVQEVEAKLESLAQLQELSRDTEKRLVSLNALAEHVTHKTRALEAQKHTVEHAVVEATRLNEMVWNMDAQIAKLSDGRDQLQRTEEMVARVERLARSTHEELAAATAAREAFMRESTQLEGQGRALTEALRGTLEKLSVDKQEFDAFDQRLKALSAAVGETESRVQTVIAKDEALATMQQRADALSKVFAGLTAETEELARKQDGLAALADQLTQLETLGTRTAAQHQSLMQSQQDLEAVRRSLAEFHTAHAEAAQLRDKLALDRTALEAFAERTAAMLARAPEIESRLDTVLGKMALVDEGGKAAARLETLSAELDAQLTRVSTRLQFVEKLDERVNGLHAVTADVERKLGEQLARRAEIEGLKSLAETLSAQILDAQHKLDSIAAAQARLGPVTTQVAALQQALQEAQKLAESVKRDDAAVHAHQAKLAELAMQGQQQAAEAAERARQVQAVNEDLGRATALKVELMAELARVQASQRDAMAQIGVAEGQLERAETMARQLEQRRAQLQTTEKAIAAFEARLADLGRSAEGVDQKIKSLADREALVQAVKAEVDHIRSISGKSREDLQFVTEHRGEVTALRAKVEDLLGRLEETDGKIALIELRRKTVEEVQSRASTITSMLGDINVNLEMLGEQRAVIDHVGEQLARLDYTVQEAQNTLRALQREREVAERIEQGIKALRTRSTGAPASAAQAS